MNILFYHFKVGDLEGESKWPQTPICLWHSVSCDFLLSREWRCNFLPQQGKWKQLYNHGPPTCWTLSMYLSRTYFKSEHKGDTEQLGCLEIVPGPVYGLNLLMCQSPAPAARDSTWRGERCWPMRQRLSFLGLPVYFKFIFSFILLQKH